MSDTAAITAAAGGYPGAATPPRPKLQNVPRPVSGPAADALYADLMGELTTRFPAAKDGFITRCAAFGQLNAPDAEISAAAASFHAFLAEQTDADFVCRRVPQLTQLLPCNPTDGDLSLRKAQALLLAADLIVTYEQQEAPGVLAAASSFFGSMAEAFFSPGATTQTESAAEAGSGGRCRQPRRPGLPSRTGDGVKTGVERAQPSRRVQIPSNPSARI